MQELRDLTHFNKDGRARMVYVGAKPESCRIAVAAGRVLLDAASFELVQSGGMKKGDVLAVAQLAGIMGAKKSSELVPLAHPVIIDGVDMDISLDKDRLSVEVIASVRCSGRTGVEMEALTAVSAACLAVYDMCKAVQRDIVISDIRLLKKSGGEHGDFDRGER